MPNIFTLNVIRTQMYEHAEIGRDIYQMERLSENGSLLRSHSYNKVQKISKARRICIETPRSQVTLVITFEKFLGKFM